ncbi:basic-leucine zipper transcription factor [Mucor lusitanicus]|uniref:Basic-leucine zipper transcription factor n=1 Tax=Mucor lusitanicus CBS 277.49 TaxID=747725 RepID=A0A168KXE0_MUCCL|nr:basic-leucine zipper transcription factor [Mucor lusitanicus CBS 277.49]
MSDIAFEHFDPELELGNLDENGRPIRPRKKPGRKPNPPSPAQRKAQNRAAQRAFRERKRREMREAESTVKRCIYARDQALGEVRRLKRRLEELQFETNYLKGYALTLKMACVANQVEVPKFWDTGVTDEIGSEELTFSKTKGVPQQLEVFLDKKMNIISIDQHVSSLHHLQNETNNTMSDNDLPPSSILSCSSPTSSYLVDEEHAAQSPLSSSSSSSSFSEAASPGASSFVSDFENASQAPSSHHSNTGFDINDTLSSIAPQLASHLETPFFQQLLNTDLVGTHLQQPCTTHHASSSPPPTSTPHFPTTEQQQQQIGMSLPNPNEAMDQQQPPVEEEEEEKVIDAKTGLVRSVTECVDTVDADDSASSSASSASSVHSSDKKIFPPMTPLDAIHQMRAVKNLDSTTRALFTPTELQRMIRHDTRIDVVPGAALRDHMILFQDFYNANDLFDYLAESSVFLGGELGNPDSWFVPPNFFKRYWFLCPNHKHKRMDNAVEIMVNLGKKMIDLMAQRKQMYIERDQYADYFPEPTKEQVEQQVQQVVDDEFLHRDDQQHLDDMYQQQQQQCMEMFAMDEDEDEDMLDHQSSSQPAQHGQLNLLDSDLPLDQFMTMINNATMPRLAPHSFAV